ncbi:hypothetical protein [Motilibacter peucedani]|nr:hypothetical protein [Motilibacter peucedani]
MKAQHVVALLVVLLLVYAASLGEHGVLLVRDGRPVPVVLGVAVLLLPVVGIVLVAAELRFGRRVEALGRRLDAEGGLPADELPRRPSGRADRAAADQLYQRRRAEVEASPEDWRPWFRLAMAYDDAGDRTRARKAMRTAVALHAAHEPR